MPGEQSSQSDMPKHSAGAVRTLYFHTGTHKMGSTALQTYLAANKELLGKAGISYEFPVGSDQTMGKGQYFYGQIYERRIPDRPLEYLLEFYLADWKIAGDHAHFFSGNTPDELAVDIRHWLDLLKKGTATPSKETNWLTWEASARQLSEKIISMAR